MENISEMKEVFQQYDLHINDITHMLRESCKEKFYYVLFVSNHNKSKIVEERNLLLGQKI